MTLPILQGAIDAPSQPARFRRGGFFVLGLAMLDSVWIIERSFADAREFVCIVADAVRWVPCRDDAERFDTKAGALKVAEAIAAEASVAIAVYPLGAD